MKASADLSKAHKKYRLLGGDPPIIAAFLISRYGVHARLCGGIKCINEMATYRLLCMRARIARPSKISAAKRLHAILRRCGLVAAAASWPASNV